MRHVAFLPEVSFRISGKPLPMLGSKRLVCRSIAATVAFMLTGSITATIIHGESASPPGALDWSLGDFASTFAVAQASLFLISLCLYKAVSLSIARGLIARDSSVDIQTPKPQVNSDGNLEELSTHRRFASFLTAVQFGLGLHLASLTVPSRVVQFLVTPFHRDFDPTLAFLALGALPVATISYFYGRGEEKPRLGGKWTIPTGGVVDGRLLVGAAIFGIGWGIQGLCRTSDAFPIFGKTVFECSPVQPDPCS